MPKGVPLTDEQKEAMAEGRRKAKAQKAAAEAQAADDELAEQIRAEVETQGEPPIRVSEPSFDATPAGGVQEWGPYTSYMEVHTQYGLFGLPAWTIMHFEKTTVFHYKQDKYVDSMRPVYRKVTKELVS